MKMKKTIAMIMAITMITGAFAACGEKEDGTPHTTYSVDEINNMSDDELEAALEQAAQEMEASEKATEETAAAEAQVEEIDIWKDVEVTFMGSEGVNLVWVSLKYTGTDPFVRDNVVFKYGDKLLNEGGSFIGNLHYDYTLNVDAHCDSQVLSDANVTLTGEKTAKSPFLEEGEVIFSKEYPCMGLTKPLDLGIYTDKESIMPVVNAITEKITSGDVDIDEVDDFEWAIGKEIYPAICIISGGGSNIAMEYENASGDLVGRIDVNMYDSLQVSDESGNWNEEYFELLYQEEMKDGWCLISSYSISEFYSRLSGDYGIDLR